MLNVHVRINDALTGQPAACRLRISDLSGRHYAPLGFSVDFPRGRNEDVGGRLARGTEYWFYIDGACEIPLPSGIPLLVEAWRGPDFPSLRREMTLPEGQMAIRLSFERSGVTSARAWYAGDLRCHFLTPHAALLEAQAEGLSVVQLLASETVFPAQDGLSYPIAPNLLAFSGQKPLLEKNGSLVCVNTLNQHPVLGSLSLLHCHRPVFPLRFGGPESTDDWSLADWCDQCHRKRGLVVWVDPFHTETGVPGEGWADLVLGRIDALEVTPESIRPKEWYRAWNAGLLVALVGASGKDSNRVCLGAMRTGVPIPDDVGFSLESWIEAVRSGRTIVTTGPIIEVEVDGRRIGDSLELPEPGHDLPVQATLRSAHSLRGTLEIIMNGNSVVRSEISGDEATLRSMIKVDEPGWLSARFVGQTIRSQFAHTSPVAVLIRGERRREATAVTYFQRQIEKTLEWVTHKGRFEKPRRQEQLRALLQQAWDTLNVGSSV